MMYTHILAVLIFLVNISNAKNNAIITGDFVTYDSLNGKPYTVDYDSRSFIINNRRTLILSGSIHYARLSPLQWKTILTQAKNDGLNTIQTYIFWNIHEPIYNFDNNHIYNFEDRRNLTLFFETAAEVGLFVNVRVGPYICGEFNFGGFPTWLLHDNDIKYRYNNTKWMNYISEWLTYLTNNIIEPYLSRNGGPIILSQIENEYVGLSQENLAYGDWCGNFAESLNWSNPWTMCRNMNYNNTLNTADGSYRYGYAQSSLYNWPNQPIIWTENENGNQGWGYYYNPNQYNYDDNRYPSDLSQSVALFFAAGGGLHNYYMLSVHTLYNLIYIIYVTM